MVIEVKSPEANIAVAKEHLSDDDLHQTVGHEWTFEDERRIRQRMDWRIVPTVLALYLMCFIDRQSLSSRPVSGAVFDALNRVDRRSVITSNARIQGLAKDLNLVGYKFNWALTIFYIAYIAVEVPSNIILKNVGGQYYMPALVVAFGIISMCTAFVTSYSGLLVCRFFLGMAEGGLFPGAAYYMSCFYRRHELLLRMGMFIQGATLAGAFGGLLAAGLSPIHKWGLHSRPIYNWRNIFFFEGLFTLIVSGLAVFILPPTPDKCRFLTPRDQYIALQRINQEHKESSTERTRPHHIKRAFFNINNIICGLGFFSINVSVQSFSLFLPTILNALGWTALKTQFYTVPPYTVAVVWSIIIFRLSDKYKCRGIFLIFGAILAVIGYAILATATSSNVKYGAVFIAAMGAFPGGPLFIAWGLNNASGPSVRAISSAYILSIGSAGALLAVWTYLVKDAPLYKRGHFINVGANCVAGALSVIGILYTKWENKKRDAGDRQERLVGLSEDEESVLGYRHPEFRYTS